MLINFEITVDVPEKDWQDWIPYVKRNLLQRSHRDYSIKTVVYKEDLPQTHYETHEKEAIERGELGVGL